MIVRKVLTSAIIFLFISMSIVSSTGTVVDKKSTMPTNGDTLYVGGDGAGNYSSIQDAIDDAIDGDMVFVFDDSSPYYENVIVDKSINLIGEDRNNTIIDGGGSGDVVEITADGVDISGFTIMNSDQWGNGITNDPFIPVENLFICGNIIKDCRLGILLGNCKRTVISRNTICDYISDGEGIHLYNSPNSEISKNIIQNTGVWGIDCYYINNSKILNNNLDKMKCGLFLGFSNDCEISRNNFTRTTIHGLRIWGSSHNIISENNIYDNSGDSIRLYNDSNYNKIFHNNYINNTQNAYDECSNTWDDGYPSGGNYWDDYDGEDNDGDGIGDTPYDIPGGSNQDLYPLMYHYGNRVINLDTGEEFSTIQGAIDDFDTLDGHTIFAKNGMFYENVVIHKSINLIGENKDTTVINGSDGEIVVNITADGVTVSGFTVQEHNYYHKSRLINIESDENIISGNIFIGNIHYGVYIYGSEYNNISSNVINGGIASAGIRARYCNFTTINNNSISVDGIGIYLSFSNNNDIIGNTITSCDNGIYLSVTRNNTIYRNIITNNYFSGITSVSFSANNTVILNDISYNEWFGIIIMNSFKDKIIQNNFIGHDCNAYFYHELYSLLSVCEMTGDKPFIPKIYWDGNYWDEPRLQPFFITGLICFYHYIMYIYPRLTGKLPINWVNFDLHPAQEPYDIDG